MFSQQPKINSAYCERTGKQSLRVPCEASDSQALGSYTEQAVRRLPFLAASAQPGNPTCDSQTRVLSEVLLNRHSGTLNWVYCELPLLGLIEKQLSDWFLNYIGGLLCPV